MDKFSNSLLQLILGQKPYLWCKKVLLFDLLINLSYPYLLIYPRGLCLSSTYQFTCGLVSHTQGDLLVPRQLDKDTNDISPKLRHDQASHYCLPNLFDGSSSVTIKIKDLDRPFVPNWDNWFLDNWIRTQVIYFTEAYMQQIWREPMFAILQQHNRR